MYKLQAYWSDDKMKKDLDAVANIIISEKLDIAAMQDIRHNPHEYDTCKAVPGSPHLHLAPRKLLCYNKPITHK